jgi:hypothetical protein
MNSCETLPFGWNWKPWFRWEPAGAFIIFRLDNILIPRIRSRKYPYPLLIVDGVNLESLTTGINYAL